MRLLVYILILIVIVSATFKITFDMTQEITGSYFINGYMIDHGVHTELISALNDNDIELAKKIALGMQSYNKEVVTTMVTSLETGRYYFLTKDEVSKGRNFLEELESSTN